MDQRPGRNEEQLVREAINGDADALSGLLELHSAALRPHIERDIPKRWRSLLSVDDVMQQTYVDAFRHIHGFVPHGEGALAAWLRTIANRNLLDALRMLEADKRGGGRRRIEPRTRDESLVALCDMFGQVSSTPSRKVARAEASRRLSEAIEALPANYRQVVEMYDLEGRSIEEVAAALDRSPGAVYMLRARAHGELAKLMGATSQYFTESP